MAYSKADVAAMIAQAIALATQSTAAKVAPVAVVAETPAQEIARLIRENAELKAVGKAQPKAQKIAPLGKSKRISGKAIWDASDGEGSFEGIVKATKQPKRITLTEDGYVVSVHRKV